MGTEGYDGNRGQDRGWRLVVGLDGSQNSLHALAWAIKLATSLDAEVIAVHATQPLAFGYPVTPPYLSATELDEDTRRRIQMELEGAWCEPLRKASVRYRARLELGRAAHVLSDVANQEGADAILVGRRGRGAATEALLGSVSHELGHRSATPVVIIQPE